MVTIGGIYDPKAVEALLSEAASTISEEPAK